MINFWNSVSGLVLIIVGTLLLFKKIKKQSQIEDKDIYGNNISIYFGIVGLILLGFCLLIRELLKI
jgi:hypothetical protein